MNHLEISCAVRPIEWPLDVKCLMKHEFCMILGLRREEYENCTLLGDYAAL